MVSITSVELNYIVFRYLQESGFNHTAFTFGIEAGVNKFSIDGNSVPTAALVSIIQKGLLYMEMEANLCNTKDDTDEDFSFLQPMDLITKDVDELQKIVNDRKKIEHVDGRKESEQKNEGGLNRVKDKARKNRQKRDVEREDTNRMVKGTKRVRKQKDV